MDPNQTQIETTLGKNAIKRRQQLIQKKLSQGLKTISTQEKKKIDQFISNDPTQIILLLTFGNGQEEDYTSISKELDKFSPQYINEEEI